MDVALLYRTHHEALYRYLSRFCGDPDMAGDAVQEAFLRIQRRPPVAEANLKAWLFTVATNVVRDQARVGARRQVLLAEGTWQLPMADAPVDPAVLVEADERRRAVTEALARLRERERTALLMREEGMHPTVHHEIQ